MTTELLLRVNGIQPSYGIEFGLDNERTREVRDDDPYRQANVSFSLLQCGGDKIIRHTLIDVGMGVVPSLLDLERQFDVHVVHEVFITHPHLDHYAQLKWLAGCARRSGRPEQPYPLPVHCTQECWDAGPMRIFPWVEKNAVHQPLEFLSPVPVGDATITPFEVHHGESAPGAAGFVIQHPERKIVITSDFLTIPNEDDPLLMHADVCFIESNTWHPCPRNGHQSITDGLRLLEKWQPKRTYLLHYSGFEDGEQEGETINGPMSLKHLQREAQQAAGHQNVDVATHGMVLGRTVDWPK